MINKYDLFKDIMEHRSTHCGFWHGNPHWESQGKLYKYFGVQNDFDLGLKLDDTFVWSGCGWIEFDLNKNLDIPHLSELTDDDIDLVDKLNWPEMINSDLSYFKSTLNAARTWNPCSERGMVTILSQCRGYIRHGKLFRENAYRPESGYFGYEQKTGR